MTETDQPRLSSLQQERSRQTRRALVRMLPGSVQLVRYPIWMERTEVLRSPGTGVWHAAVERGHAVTQGSLLGTLTDFFGNVVGEVRAPFAGEVLYIVATPAMTRGEPVGMIGAPRP